MRARRRMRWGAHGGMSTVQYDFNQPERFGLEYTAPDDSRKRPSYSFGKLGSVERFIGVLTEHYAGAFPAWLTGAGAPHSRGRGV